MWPVATSGNQRLRKESAIQSLSARLLWSRGPMWPAAGAGNEGEADATTGRQRAENSAEPGPERPATQWQERKKMGSTSVETTGHLSVRALKQ